MLHFILGRAATGKSYNICERIAECVDNGINPILIVPEQFSFESEKRILDRLGDDGAQKVKVLSFSRLCDEVERSIGGICGKSLSDADRLILMSRAVILSANDLKVWGKYSRSSGFVKMLCDTIGEFKINAISVEDIIEAVKNTNDSTLALKLSDAATIYGNYELLLAERFIDPNDRLTKLYYALENNDFFSGKTVFLDSFKGFTGQQFRIIDRILSTAKNVTVSLCENIYDTRKYGVFSNIRHTRERIIAMSKAHGIDCNNPIILKDNFYNSADISALEDLMCGQKTEQRDKVTNITLCRAENVAYEADFVARNIRKIVREKGARYSDFVVIARDTAIYEDVLDAACAKNNVPCFIDRRIPLASLPPAVAVLSATELAKNLSTEKILRFYKSGIGYLSEDEISTLENYTYLWGIDGAMWKSEWDMDERGFQFSEKGNGDQQFLSDINALRRRAITPILNFRAGFKGSASNMSRSIVALFDEIDAKNGFIKLSNAYKNEGNVALCDAMRQGFDKIMEILGSLVTVFGEGQMDASDFADALANSLAIDTVGVIPQMIDEVTFGAADRIRPSRPRYAFIMGANQNVFPRAFQGGGLFKNNEREKLIELGLELPDNTLTASIDEEFLVYSNVCCATDSVFISYSASLSDGSAAEPSAFVGDIVNKFNCTVLCEPSPLSEQNAPETLEDAFGVLCNKISTDECDAKTLLSVLGAQEKMQHRIENAVSLGDRPKFSVTPDTAHKLFGERLYMSPSKFDNFSRCSFMYFCRNGLKVESLQPAQFNVMQRGTMVHFVLEHIIEEFGKDVSKLTSEEISDNVERLADMYLDGIAGYRSVETPRSRYLVTTVTRSLKYVVERLALEFAQSDFTPVKCELKIGADGDMPEIKVPLDNGCTLSLTGIVDRVDEYDGYVRIVDYKTGSREFKLPDILFGQNMQMLLYLYAITNSEEYGGIPAGIFYMPAMRAKDSAPKKRRMSGLMAKDEALLYAMDKTKKGEFVPEMSSRYADSFIEAQDFDKIFDFTARKLKTAGNDIYSGNIAANPVDGLGSPACKYCEFASVCRIEKEKPLAVPRLSNTDVISEIERQVEEDGI